MPLRPRRKWRPGGVRSHTPGTRVKLRQLRSAPSVLMGLVCRGPTGWRCQGDPRGPPGPHPLRPRPNPERPCWLGAFLTDDGDALRFARAAPLVVLPLAPRRRGRTSASLHRSRRRREVPHTDGRNYHPACSPLPTLRSRSRCQSTTTEHPSRKRARSFSCTSITSGGFSVRDVLFRLQAALRLPPPRPRPE